MFLFLIDGRYLARRLQDEFRIDPGAVPTNAEEQMWPRGAARGSHAAEPMPLPDRLAALYIDVGKMKIHADETVAMIDEHGIAFEEHIFRHCYGPVCDR